jgi:signal transduction histidine kinase
VTETGPFTELNTRRLGPVRRFFVRHPRAMDGVVVALVAITAGTSDLGSGASRLLAAAIGFAVIAAAAFVWRRSRPLHVTAAVVALGILSLVTTGSFGGLELALAFALYAVAASRPAQTAWLTASVAVAVSVGAVWLWEEPSPDPITRGPDGSVVLMDDRWGSTAQVLILALAGIAIGISVRNRRDHLAEIMNRANALARDRDRQVQLARAAERSRIAREMHDVVAHSLSVMITLADGAAIALDRTPDRSRAALKELSSTGRAALRDMRNVLGALANDDAPLEPTGQSQDLVGLVDRFRTAGLPLHVVGLGLEPPTDTGLRLALYRVMQESLTNVLRHAPGTPRIDLELSRHPDSWEVTVTDQGGVVPAVKSDGAGVGLVGMRERVELFGGTVEAGPAERGWRVHVRIPSREEQR